MNWVQRPLLIITGLILLLAAAREIDLYEGNHVLATFQFLAAIGLIYFAVRRSD